jgi:transcription termination factor Rho
MRRVLKDLKPSEAVELLTSRLKRTASNADFMKGVGLSR